MAPSLPIEEILGDFCVALKGHKSLVLEAPPGAGKTTLVPLEMLKHLDGKIILLEPRRLAARMAAARMAFLLGEKVGETVGYRVRLDSKVSKKTRIEVVTEGVLIRRLQDDGELAGVSAVIFDEYHERSLEADFGLALTLDVQEGLREDLKIIVMSATLDGKRVAGLLGGAPVITSSGRTYPVEHHFLPRKMTGRLENEITDVIKHAVKDEGGSLLVFLPGAGEIRRVENLLKAASLGPDIMICPLYGMMKSHEQDAAISPAPAGKRKIVLATSIAETSLTIEGVRVVIDGGLERRPSFDVRSGMSRLVTEPLSKASATQRAGRAGRLEPGICYRMWTEAADRGLKAFSAPEILSADLLPLTLDLLNWGVDDPAKLRWLDVPDQASFAASCDLLKLLGALDPAGRITPHGRDMAKLPMHPRLAHMVLKGRKMGQGALAVDLAALLSERDILGGSAGCDMRLRLDALRRGRQGTAQVKTQAKAWRRSLKITQEGNIEKCGILMALAYPDRVGGLRKGGVGRFLLSGGRGAQLGGGDALAGENYLAIGALDRGQREARIYLAAPVTLDELEAAFDFQKQTLVEWDEQKNDIKARAQLLLGRLPLKDIKIENPDPGLVQGALITGIRKKGLAALPWDKGASSLRTRNEFARARQENNLPDMSDDALLAGLEDWLGPYLDGVRNWNGLQKIPLLEILGHLLGWEGKQRLDRLVPAHITVPSGSHLPIDYSVDPPVLAVRLQEMFGLMETPTVAGAPLLLHLLSPAGRPLQVTSDLGGFWKTSYDAVKKDMKGRYPKHNWPDDPVAAQATNRVKRKTPS